MLDFNHQRATPIDKPEPEHRPRSRNQRTHMFDINAIVAHEQCWYTLRIDYKDERYICLGIPKAHQHKYENGAVYNIEPNSIEPVIYSDLHGVAFVSDSQSHSMDYSGPLTPQEVQTCLEVAKGLWHDYDLENMRKRQEQQKELLRLEQAQQDSERSAKNN